MARNKSQSATSTETSEEDTNMSDTQEETTAAEAVPAKTKKDPVPDGWETPVQFAKRLSAKLGTDFRPQLVYGFIKNSKQFPFKQNTDGHFIVDIEPALVWFDEKEARKAERVAAKAAKAAAAMAADTNNGE